MSGDWSLVWDQEQQAADESGDESDKEQTFRLIQQLADRILP